MSSGKGFWLNEGGATAALYALALPALVAVAGVGFDYARLAGMDSELQNAADQAALAAVTQLDGKGGACSRAASAASGLVTNSTLLANDSGGLAVSVTNEATCDATGIVRFWQNEAATAPATTDAEAKFVEIVLGARRANYALTPIVGAFGGNITAAALAGLGSAICGTSAVFYCNPDIPAGYNWDAAEGTGVILGDRSGAGSWGYLRVGETQDLEAVEEALGQDQPALECRSASETPTAFSGSSRNLNRYLNTRFDVFENLNAANAPCSNREDCSPAGNVLKDLVKEDGATTWSDPANIFDPKPYSGAYSPTTNYDLDGLIDAMGLPRDLCHYKSYAHGCGGVDISLGDKNWARKDYFDKYYTGGMVRPSGHDGSVTRYKTYLWEIQNRYNVDLNPSPAGQTRRGNQDYPLYQFTRPVTVAASTGAYDRRVITVAIAKSVNGSCPGAGQPVPVDEWVDMFLVEPAIARSTYPNGINTNNNFPIYAEVIGRSSRGSTGAQLTSRDVPYLVR